MKCYTVREMEHIGVRIKALREAAGISQTQLAERISASPSTVSMYESGKREPGADTLAMLADILGVTIDYLITGQSVASEKKPVYYTGAAIRPFSVAFDDRDTELEIYRRAHDAGVSPEEYLRKLIEDQLMRK